MDSDPRRPAGAPEDWERRGPAGAPEDQQEGAEPAAHDQPPTAEKAASEEAAGKVDADLDQLLADTKRERDEYLELAQRTKADFENYRKRMAAETERAAQRGKSELAEHLIGVLDNLERALAAAGVDPSAALSGEAEAPSPLEQGALLTYRDLHSNLARAGIEVYDPSGEPFDPTWHEALSTRADDGAGPGRVLETLSKGYRLDGQVIRPARVVVSE
jgi:molecular chaperone GrpE